MQYKLFLWLVGALLASLFSLSAWAEPYLAVRKGLQCQACHVNPTGGGKRNTYGNQFAQLELPANDWSATTWLTTARDSSGIDKKTTDEMGAATSSEEPRSYWSGDFGPYVSIGADFRGGLYGTDIPNQPDSVEFIHDETLVYIELRLVENILTIYIDEQIAPNTAFNRESYGLFRFDNQKYYAKAGKFFLPYGLRLEDDMAFIRRAPGINFFTPEQGVEAGLEINDWSAHFAITEGTGSGTGKRYSMLGNYVKDTWRIGSSFNFNDADQGDKRMANIFAGLHFEPVTWLAEVDYINDGATGMKMRAGLLEANIDVGKGQNIKITLEYLDPNTAVPEDQQTRNSLVWELTPVQFTQVRLGFRDLSGITSIDTQNTKEFFVQLHLFL